MSGPANVVGHFQSAFVERALAGPEAFASGWVEVRAEEAVGAFVGPEVGLAAIVAAEKEDGVVVDLQLFE